ncbi:MAG: CotH kinase family protein [Alphaproteobacteria bacterium]|nr:CotH kinase family protein [Alphaproteobacteria bacterium]
MIRNKYFLLFFLIITVFIFNNCKKITQTQTSEIQPADTNNQSKIIFAVDIGNSSIPYIKIQTNNKILTSPKVLASFEIFQNKKSIFNSPIGIEYRGSTSFRLSDKKSFGIETLDSLGEETDKSIFGFPEESDWVLIGDVYNIQDKFLYDPTLISHHLAYQLARNIGDYASRTIMVELELNGEYQGIYMFGEKLKRNSNRINIKKLSSSATQSPAITGGYIFKIDKTSGDDVAPGMPFDYYLTNWQDDYAYNIKNSFRSRYSTNGQLTDRQLYLPKLDTETYFLYEYPKADDITLLQKTYLQNYIDSFENALIHDDFTKNTRTYTNFVDINSFIDYFIINELCRNIDAYRISTFLYKDYNAKINIGPVWDFNLGYYWGGRVPSTDWIINYNTYQPDDLWQVPFWWQRLLADPVFTAALKQRWAVLRSDILSNTKVINLVNNIADNLISNGAITRNFNKWNAFPIDYKTAISNLIQYFNNQFQFMDTKIKSL